MHKQVKELVEWAEQIGYVLDGFDGQGHYRLKHRNGARATIAATPSDWRGTLNAQALLKRLAGVKVEGKRASRYRHERQSQQLTVSKSCAESAAGETTASILRRWETVSAHLLRAVELNDAMGRKPERDLASWQWHQELNHLAGLLSVRHAPVPVWPVVRVRSPDEFIDVWLSVWG